MSLINPEKPLILVTGATGYIGGRLVRVLLEKGYRVRCLVRTPRKLESRTWRNHPDVEVVQADLLDQADGLPDLLSGCDSAYYLVHAMISAGDDFARQDREMAKSFALACERAGVERIVYLGGLGEMGENLSKHLRSRREVELALATTSVPVVTLRAAMIIGAGSASFEILRYLVERLPVMITPRWVQTECQPVGIRDVLYWLVKSLSLPAENRVLEVGGKDVHTYLDLMRISEEELGLPKRLILGVPFLTPRLSSGWISLITPVTYRIARPLAEGLKNRVVVGDKSAQDTMPHEPLSAREAIREAIRETTSLDVETRWSAAGPIPGDPDWAGGKVFEDHREIIINASPLQVFNAVCRIGGGHGWYAADILWRIRGWMDQMAGGPGLRRGRRHPETVDFGESLDFWRVVGIERNKSLHLHAEMKLPGTARLEFLLSSIDKESPQEKSNSSGTPPSSQRTLLQMTARFRPKGLAGILYWYSVLPLHHIVFSGMLNGIKRSAESHVTADTSRGDHRTSIETVSNSSAQATTDS